MIDVAYSTFWNDFSHYSFYLPSDQIKGDVKAISDVPLDYSDLQSHSQDNLLFADKTNYITDYAGSFKSDVSGMVKVWNDFPLEYVERIAQYEAWKQKLPPE